MVHLSFDEGFSDAGSGFEVTRHGDEVELRAGAKGRAAFVGGTADWVDVAVDDRLRLDRGYSVELFVRREDWVNPYTSGNCSQTLVALNGLGLDVTSPCAMMKEGWALRAHVGDRSDPMSFKTPNDTILPGIWYHLALVVDPKRGVIRLYRDGEPLLSDRGTPKLDVRYSPKATLRLGTWHEANQAFRGHLDDVRIYDYPRTGAEIRETASRR